MKRELSVLDTNFTDIYIYILYSDIACGPPPPVCVCVSQESILMIVPLMSFAFWRWGLPLGHGAHD